MDALQPTVDPRPIRLGRYRITSQIGNGVSATVYRAWDDELRRDVAIRVPRRDCLVSPSQIDDYLASARQLSRLDHPRIVPLYDVGRTDDGQCYLVTKFISGGNLADRVLRHPPSAAWSVGIVVQVAEALHFVHKNGMVHGNLKPAQVLFDEQDLPCLTDFGLPLIAADQLEGSTAAGGSAYQSPEQLCGEQHRIDARADVYSLGAILYELLAGQWPPSQQPVAEVVRQAMQYDPPFLSEVDPAIPRELARICQKALSRRIADRYTTVVDFAEDLRQCMPSLPQAPLTSGGSTSTDVRPGTVSRTATGTTTEAGAQVAADADGVIVPKGLRSFDQEDADFFLELLPGPRGRDGLPEILRFWKSQIEETDPDETFSVGLVYGPSGCGKSSLVKAGLLPRLDERIIAIYLEATPGGTETRLLAQLRRRCPLLPANLGLTESLAELRRGKCLPAGKKVVLFLDQFEQWLHASRDDERPELSTALRQCDGRRLQCVVMVRDDFWMAVTRFMHDLEVQLVEGRNSAAVDLFGLPHARKVLAAFGRAFECLPRIESDQTPAEKAFLDQAVLGLAHEGKVISVQLALFAEMVKNKPWTPATLDEVGGAEGIGLTFLEETFGGTHAPPEHRRHQRAARAVLRLLLPEQGTDIKGQMHSREQLLAGSGYADRPQEFDELLQILDQELRLVTPADPAGLPDEQVNGIAEKTASPDPPCPPLLRGGENISFYQLTHDFLVPSVRRWLVRKQQETRTGRAELLLEDKGATWSARPERRYLPTWWQWIRIRTLTRPRDWSASQRAMMRAARVHHGFRAALGLALATLLIWAGFETVQAARAQSLRDRLLYFSLPEVPGVIREMSSNRRWVNHFLRQSAASAAMHSPEDVRTRLALLPDDPSQVDGLYEECFAVDDQTLTLIAGELVPHRNGLTERLWNTMQDESAGGERQLRASLLLARYASPKKGEPPGPWANHVTSVAGRLHEAILADPGRFQSLVAGLAPVSDMLIDVLSERSRDVARTESDRAVAANILIEYAAGRPDVLAAVLLDIQNPARQAAVIDKLKPMAGQVVALLAPELLKRPDDLTTTWKDAPAKTSVEAGADVAATVARAHGMIAERFAFCQTLSLAEFPIVAEGLQAAGFRPTRFRPYLAGDVVLVTALWTRDDRTGKIEAGLTEAEMRQLVTSPRMKSELLVDLAAYQTPTGEEKHVAVWSDRREGDAESNAYIGPWSDSWNQFREAQQKEGWGVVAFDLRPQLSGESGLSAVLWKGIKTENWELRMPYVLERDLAGAVAGKTAAAVDLAVPANRTRADERLASHLTDIASNEKINRTNPEKLINWYYAGHRRLIIGQDQQAISDFSHYIDHGGEKPTNSWELRSSHEFRAYAAARLGQKENSARWLAQANALQPEDGFGRKFRELMLELFTGDLRDQPEAFEKFGMEWATAGWARRGIAQFYAFAAGIVRETDPPRSALYTDLAIEHLRKAISLGEPNPIWSYLTDVYFAPIVDDPRMINLQIDAELDNVAAIRFARRGEVGLARGELVKLLQTGEDPYSNLRTEFLVDVILGEDERAQRRLEAAIADQPENDARLYWGAAAGYSVASHLLTEKDSSRAREFADRAFELLRRRIKVAWGGSTTDFRGELLLHWVFVPLRGDPRMAEILAGLDNGVSVTYLTDGSVESRLLTGLIPAEHLKHCRELVGLGFRPVSIDACLPAGASIPGAASVWHRPRVSEQQRDEFARRQSSAAVALLRLGKPDVVWPLLNGNSAKAGFELGLRTWLVQLLGPTGTDPLVLARRLSSEPVTSARRSLLLALGQSIIDKLLPADRDAVIEQVLVLYGSDPDPGIHSAAEWALKKWNQKDRIAAANATLAVGTANPPRRWSVTANGQVLVAVPAPVEFLMGTPNTEPERDAIEARHRRRIPRSFEIATKEVTVRQWETFLKANPQIKYQPNRNTSPEADCPVGTVNWYQIAAYCRWLSAKEQIHEDEIGYPPLDQIRGGMQLKSHFLSRAGYRLPTEAEWEYACRANTETRWYHGESVELLPQFAWFKDNSQGRSWPVGTLRPNDLGLFDILGNIEELCHQHLISPKSADDDVRDDSFASQRLSQHVSLRGGSYFNERRDTRSGRRWDYGAQGFGNGAGHIGFRVVRTLIPPELQQARQLRRQAIETRRTGELAAAARERSQAQVAYEQLLTRYPDNPDYPWELADFLLEPTADEWQILRPTEVASRNGATLAVQADGAILASGKNPDEDVYMLRFAAGPEALTALRLDVLSDPSLPGNGPGRYTQNGNFHLTEFRVSTGLQTEPELRTPVSIRRASADYSQSDGAVSDAIDGDRKTRWGIAHAEGLPHWAIFGFQDPVNPDATAQLIVELDFQDPQWKQTSLGRFRISASSAPDAERLPLWQARLARSSLNGWSRLAAAHVLLGNPSAAQAAFAKAGKQPHGEFADDLFLLALLHQELGHPEEARAWLERGLARFDKTTGDAMLRQLVADSDRIALESEPPDLPLLARIRSLLRVQTEKPASAPDETLFTRSRRHLETGELDKAVVDLAKALSLLPESFGWETSRAKAAFAISDLDEAFLNRAELQPYATDLWLARARRNAFRTRWQEAANDLGRVFASLPAGEEWIEYGELLILAGRHQEYAQLTQAAVEKFGKNADPRTAYLLARAACLSRAPVVSSSQVVSWAEQAFAAGRKPWRRRVLGMAQFRNSQFETARQTIEQSLAETRDDGENVLNLFGLALVQSRMGNDRVARECLDAARSSLPANTLRINPADWLELQILRREAEELILAPEIRTLTEELASDSKERTRLLNRRARLHERMHHWSEAAADYGRLVDLDDKQQDASRGQVNCLINQRDWKAAAESVRRLWNANPDLELHMRSMQLLTLLAAAGDGVTHRQLSGDLLKRVSETRDPVIAERIAKAALLLPNETVNLAAAVRMADRSVTLDPKHTVMPWALPTRALAAYRQGDDPAALDWAERSLKADEAAPLWYRSAMAYTVIAMAQHRLGQPQAARGALFRAAALIQPTTDRNDAADEFDGEWHNWLIADLLLREARQLINGSSPSD